jgi:hypothetical protein
MRIAVIFLLLVLSVSASAQFGATPGWMSVPGQGIKTYILIFIRKYVNSYPPAIAIYRDFF